MPCGSSLVPSTSTALSSRSAPPINTSLPICSDMHDSNGSDPQCSEDSTTGSPNVLDIKVKSPSPPSSPASLIAPSDSQEILTSVNPTHNICAGSLTVPTSRLRRIMCYFCNLILNKKNIKVHIQRRHMSVNPDLLQTNGLSHTHVASRLVFFIFRTL